MGIHPAGSCLILVIPEINVEEIGPLCRFIADIDGQLPVCFLAFRPNYVLNTVVRRSQ